MRTIVCRMQKRTTRRIDLFVPQHATIPPCHHVADAYISILVGEEIGRTLICQVSSYRSVGKCVHGDLHIPGGKNPCLAGALERLGRAKDIIMLNVSTTQNLHALYGLAILLSSFHHY